MKLEHVQKGELVTDGKHILHTIPLDIMMPILVVGGDGTDAGEHCIGKHNKSSN